MTSRKLRVVAAGAFVGGFLALGGSAAFGQTSGAVPFPTAHADHGGAHAAALSIPHLVGVSQAEASQSHESEWSAVSLFDHNVIGQDEGGSSGILAPLGGAVDPINEGTCPGSFSPACVLVLPAYVDGSQASGEIAGVYVHYEDSVGVNRHANLEVLPSNAESSECQRNADSELLHLSFLLPLDLTQDLHLGAVDADNNNCVDGPIIDLPGGDGPITDTPLP